MNALSFASLAAVGVVVALRLVAVDAAETNSLDALRQEVVTLRAQNAALLRENAELKSRLASAAPAAATAGATAGVDDGLARQEDKPKNRIRLPSNVTIDHNPR